MSAGISGNSHTEMEREKLQIGREFATVCEWFLQNLGF